MTAGALGSAAGRGKTMVKTRVGLEITEESVRAVEVTRGRRSTVVACGEVPLPSGAAKDSEIIDADAVALALRALWAQAGITSRNVVVAIGNRRILVREHSAPVMPMATLREALPYQVQDLLPVPVDQAVLDFYAIGEANGQLHGLLVAAVSEQIEQIVDTLKKAKLHTDAVDLAPFGLARVARVVAPGAETVAMVHIGEHTTFVVVASNGMPRFVRIIPAEVASAATERRAAIEVVEEQLVEVSVVADRAGRSSLRVGRAEAPVRPTAEAVPQSERGVADLVNRIRSTLAFYSQRPGATPLSMVKLSGAGAADPAITAALYSSLGIAVDLVTVGEVAPLRGKHTPGGESAFNLVTTLGVVLGEDS